MFGEFVQNICGWCDGVRTEVESQSCFFGSSNESVGSGFVACDVHVSSGHLVACLYAIHIGYAAVCVVSVVVSGLYDLYVGFSYAWLLGKFLSQEVEGNLQVTVEEPAYQSEGKHIAALEHAFHIHTAVLQAVFHHGGEWAGNDSVGVYAHLAQVILSLERCFLKVLGTEAVGIDDDGRSWLGISVLCLERSSIHGHQHIALVTRSVNLPRSYMYLESRHTSQGTLRSSDVCRVIGKSADAVTHCGRNG